MRSVSNDTATKLQRLAAVDLDRAIALGLAEGRRQQSLAIRDLFRGAGLGLTQLFGLHRRQARQEEPRYSGSHRFSHG